VLALTSSGYESLGFQLMGSLLPQLTAIYPTIIILLVAVGRARLESTVTIPTLSQPIQFGSSSYRGSQGDVEPRSRNSNTSLRLNTVTNDDHALPDEGSKNMEKMEKDQFV